MKKRNKKYYITMAIILIIYAIIIITDGIKIGPKVMVGGNSSYGEFSPAVMPYEKTVLIFNIIIMLIANTINVIFVIRDKKNIVKKIGLLIFILLSIFLIPIIGYSTIWNIIF